MRRFAFGALLAALMLAGCQVPSPDVPLDIIVFDVDNGNAIFVRTPDGRTCLIDGGPTYAGANQVWPVLDSLQVREVDYCFALNYTAGRIGGLDEVIRRLQGEEGILFRCYDRGYSVSTPEFEQYAAAVGRRRHRMRPGDEVTMGELRIRCLAANGRVQGMVPLPAAVEEDRGLALLLTYRNFDLLVPGDLSAATESPRPNLASRLADIVDEVEVLAVGGQGGPHAVSYLMHEKLNPVVSVISVGPDQESLPAVPTLTQLARRGRRVYVTNRTATTAIPEGRGRVMNGDVWISVYPHFYTVAGDTIRALR